MTTYYAVFTDTLKEMEYNELAEAWNTYVRHTNFSIDQILCYPMVDIKSAFASIGDREKIIDAITELAKDDSEARFDTTDEWLYIWEANDGSYSIWSSNEILYQYGGEIDIDTLVDHIINNEDDLENDKIRAVFNNMT